VEKMVGEVATVIKELEEARKACALSNIYNNFIIP